MNKIYTIISNVKIFRTALLVVVSNFILILPIFANIEEENVLKIIAQEKDKHNIKSVIFGVWQDNKLVASGALGESMRGVPATKDMHFRIGGVTETFLSTLLLLLVEEGKASLDDKVSKWLPDLPHSDLVTLQMLANSTSGYPDYVLSKDFLKVLEKDAFKKWTTQELLDYAFAMPVLFEPGKSWNYSHTNYVILGDILERITHQSISQLFQEKIFNKLELKHTEVGETPAIPQPVLHAYSSERGIYEDSTYWDPSWTSYSGGIISNIEDLGKWINAFGSGKLLSKKSYEAMTSPVEVAKDAPEKGYGLGFGILNAWLVQNPLFGGYSGFFAYLPSKKLSIVVFNTVSAKDSTTTNYSKIIAEELIQEMSPGDTIPAIDK